MSPAKRTSVYIAGPISGVPDENREAFKRAAEEIIFVWGSYPVNPHDIHLEAEDLTWLGYMKRCVPVVMQCERVYLLRGWWWSRGARWEFLIARFLCRLPVVFQGGFLGGMAR